MMMKRDKETKDKKRQKRKRERPMLNREREWNDVKEINKQSDKEIIDKREQRKRDRERKSSEVILPHLVVAKIKF